MSAYVGEIRLIPYNFVPKNWLPCSGQVLAASEYPTLAMVLGKTYGDTGHQATFRLPNLQGYIPIGTGQAAPGEPTYELGQAVGTRAVTLGLDQQPKHTHEVQGTIRTAKAGSEVEPQHLYLAEADANQYGKPQEPGQYMAPDMVRGSTSASGGNQPHDNLMPYLVLQYGICCEGLVPGNTAKGSFIGEICLFGGTVLPDDFIPCHGQRLTLATQAEATLISLLGITYGDATKVNDFAVPDLRGRAVVGAGAGARGLSPCPLGSTGGARAVLLEQVQLPVHDHSAVASTLEGSMTLAGSALPRGNYWAKGAQKLYGGLGTSTSTMASDVVTGYATDEGSGGNQPHENRQPSLPLACGIATMGYMGEVDEQYVGEIRVVGFGEVPRGWAVCDGALLNVKDYPHLAELLGATYGGDGTRQFGLPDLRSRVPVGSGDGYRLGEMGGQERVALTTAQLAAHSHKALRCTLNTARDATSKRPTDQYPAQGDADQYASGTNCTFAADALALTVEPNGGGQLHENRQPYVALQYLIALRGLYPNRP